MRDAWRDGKSHLYRKHYQVDGADRGTDRVLQYNGIRFGVAGGGEARIPAIAAKYCAYTNFPGGCRVRATSPTWLAGHSRRVGTRSTFYSEARSFGNVTADAWTLGIRRQRPGRARIRDRPVGYVRNRPPTRCSLEPAGRSGYWRHHGAGGRTAGRTTLSLLVST